jgi:hypothetical protein
MKILLIVVILIVSNFYLIAQKSTDKVGIGFNYMTLDLPDDVAFSPQITYDKQIGKRLFLASKIGYLSLFRNDRFSQTIPETRKRLMFDIRPSFAILKYKKNHLKLGAGPSFWYQNDRVVGAIRFPLNNQTQVLDYRMKNVKEFNMGLSIFSEIDIRISNKMSFATNFGITNFKSSGLSSIMGITVLYEIR